MDKSLSVPAERQVAIPVGDVASVALPEKWLSLLERDYGDEGLYGLPFPGEPGNSGGKERRILWSMALLGQIGQKSLQEKILRRRRVLLNKGMLAVACGISSIPAGFFMAFACHSMLEGHIGAVAENLTSLALGALTLAGVIALSLSYFNSIEKNDTSLSSVYEKLNGDSWVYRITKLLGRVGKENISLSYELQAFASLLTSNAPSVWSQISPGDCLAMDELAGSMAASMRVMHQGSEMGLGGERSELLHRVCASALPGKLDELMDMLENPRSIKL